MIMRKRNLLCGIILLLLTLGVITSLLTGQIPNEWTDDNPPLDNPINNPKLTCFDYIDQLLMADGLKHLEGTKWGRGTNNIFIIDIEKQEFHYVGDFTDVKISDLTADWYKKDFDTFVTHIYRHSTGEVTAEVIMRVNPSMDPKLYTTIKEELKDLDSLFYEFPFWMTHYVEQSAKFGCPLGISEETLLDKYKTKISTAEAKDVLSSFDLKSTDGILRYFNDVHKVGTIEDDPRFREITNLDDYVKLQNTIGFDEGFYMINILYKDPAKLTFERDRSDLAARVIEEFVKDVVYPNTPRPEEQKTTIGVYFIYADNPNFKYMYNAPGKTMLLDNSVGGRYMNKFHMPFEGTVLYANKGEEKPYFMYPLSVGNIQDVLEHYIFQIEHIYSGAQFSDDFIRNYTRPFSIRWQRALGLEEFMNEKYGFINRNVKYLH